MNCFGKKEKFAIVVEVVGYSDNHNPFGHIQIFVNSRAFGDWQTIESFGTIAAKFAHFPTYNVVDNNAFNFAAMDVIQQVKEASFKSEDEIEAYNYFISTKYPGEFLLLSGISESFDDEFLIFLENNDKGRFIWMDKDESVREVVMDRLDYIVPVSNFIEWWKAIYETPPSTH